MHRRFRQVLTSLREHTCVSYAKLATIGGFCDLDLLLVKATSPNDLPLPERYVHEILKIFSVSPSSYRAFSLAFTRRFGRTKCWRVALKCLILLHRLLRALPNNSPFRTEFLFARSNGLLSLYPCHFYDSSSFASKDYTTFIRSYAHLLNEALDCLSLTCYEADEDNKEEEEEEEEQQQGHEKLPDKMKELGEVLEILPQVQSLIDRVMDCQPVGAAARTFLIHSAMKYIIRDSFVCYTTFRKEIVVVLDNLFQMPYRCSATAFGVYKKAAGQANQLREFYDWCKLSTGLCGLYEYPFVDQIPQIQIQALENFLNGMWQLTDSSSSTSSTMQSPSSSTEEDDQGDKQLIVFDSHPMFKEKAVVKKVARDEEMEPLIKLDDDVEENNVSWEVLLEASLSPSLVVSKNYFLFQPSGSHGQRFAHNSGDVRVVDHEANGWKMQIYNPYAINPFHQQHSSMPDHNINGSFSSNPTYPWGL